MSMIRTLICLPLMLLVWVMQTLFQVASILVMLPVGVAIAIGVGCLHAYEHFTKPKKQEIK